MKQVYNISTTLSTVLLTFENKMTAYQTSYNVHVRELQHHDPEEDLDYIIHKDGNNYIIRSDTEEVYQVVDKFLEAINYLENRFGVKWDNQKSDMPIAAVSTKTYGDEKGYPVAYRQWRADTHCNVNHGYNMKFHFEFECCDLDARNWCVDYGSLKSLKDTLDDWFDHKTLVSEDDPKRESFEKLAADGLADITYVEATGCEALAQFLWNYMEDIWLPDNGYSPRIRMHRIEVRETNSNMAYVTRNR